MPGKVRCAETEFPVIERIGGVVCAIHQYADDNHARHKIKDDQARYEA